MTEAELRRKLLINSISNYLRMVLRLALGLLMFRMLYPRPDGVGGYHGLPPEEFGFWALLWSIFGYGILMDFGLGTAAQKKVAELSVHKKWEELSRVLSTIVYIYFLSGVVIIAGALLSSHWLIGLFNVTDPNRELFRQVLEMYLCFIGLSFPIGISAEILYGQQRIALANNLASLGTVASFLCVAWALHLHWGLKPIMALALLCSIVPSLAAGWLGLRSLPQVRILPRYCSWQTARETMRFSVFAYLSIITTVIMQQTDRLVLSMLLSVTAVAIYQAGAKVADIFWSFTGQLPESLSPAAAHLDATGDRAALQRLLLDGTRFNVMIATPLYILCAGYMEGLLSLLTKGQATAGMVFYTGQVLLVWSYSLMLTHTVTKKIFFMCGHERRVTRLSIIEAVAKLGLSLALVLWLKNVVSVAIGSLVPSLIIGWFCLWPWAAKDADLNGWQFARYVLFRNLRASLPVAIFAGACRWIPALDFRHNLPLFLVEGSVAGVLAAAGCWQWALTAEERTALATKIRARLSRPQTT